MYNTVSQSTDSTITFHYSKSLKAYDTSSYSPVLTDGRMSLDEVQKTLQDIAGIQKQFHQRFIRSLWRLILVQFLCAVAYIILVLANTVDSVTVIPIIPAVIIISIVGGSAWIFFIYVTRLALKRSKEIETLLDDYNQSLVGRGLRWRLSEEFIRGIELSKEYYNQGGSLEMAVNTGAT